MAKPRRGYLFPLDARVLSAGAELHRTGHERFYGLEVARLLRRERSSVYKSLHRLVTVGLLEEHWEERRCYYQLTPFGRESVIHARLGRRVFGRSRGPRRRVRPMQFTGRRIVTGHDAEGRDVILSDGPPPGVIDPGRTSGGSASPTGCGSTARPASVDDGGEVPAGPRRLEPPPGGCSVC